ncbi:glycosyltransferase family 2 protein [Leeia sp.]|uniref:glycosyltransferase family 2 protein n=1 Tax=Leeia sp. TaxID=2884678 RepID=UPI0035B16FEF
MRQPLSAVLITLNEASQLPATLAALQFCDEIVVVDSGSSDDTVALAEAAGARVIHQPWLGFAAQKQFATEQASHDWVLSIDADERVSDTLRASIELVLQQPQHAAYQMPRCNRFMGRWLRHGEGYPDRIPRLFHRQQARWSQDPVHEHVVTEGSMGLLKGDLLHESADDLHSYLAKQNRYTSLQAERLAARGKRVSGLKLWLSPLLRFFKMYVLRLGMLDGVPGLVHISIGCFNSFIKYAKARELLRRQQEKRP